MDIIELNNKSISLAEKYAPKKIKDIIGSKIQVNALVSWLEDYEKNARINLKKLSLKQTGKKSRRRKAPKINEEEIEELDEINIKNDGGLDNEDNAVEIEIPIKKIKKKEPCVCSCAIVTGDHGTGKTAIVRAILNDMNYVIKSINFAKLEKIKSIDDFIENTLRGDDIYESMENIDHRKFAIIVDDIQSASTPNEKKVIVGLLKFNSELWRCPIIFIGSNKHKKIMSVIKKECYNISLYPPEQSEMLDVLEKIGLGEKLRFENEETIIKIINHSQNDYRRLIVTLGELYRIYNKDCITKKAIEQYITITGTKDMDKSIYENTIRLFTHYEDINSQMKIYESDKSNMPLMVQQNHFSAATGYLKNKSKSIEIISDITKNIARGDVIDNYIYSEQNWSLQETYGFLGCVYPSYKLNQTIDTARLINDSIYPYYQPKFISSYPKDLNRTSTRCINYKNVKSANECFQDMTIDDYVLASQLIKHLLEDDRIKECEELLKEYNLSAQNIMYVLKIDKINGTRKDVPESIEKKVKEIAVEPIKLAVIRKGKN